MGKVNIPNNAKIRVYWDDKAENYSRENRNRIRGYFANKYGVSRNSINVIFRPVKKDKDGNVIEMTGIGIDNIMDISYQHQLFKEWLERENKKVDFNRLLALDKKVNNAIDFNQNELNYRSWSLKSLMINNFLCFGENNMIPFTKLNGINVVTSEPLNQGGKTTFSIDAVLFLFFGNTTKTDKNEDIFNQFTDKKELMVRGVVEIDSDEYVIERRMTRSAKRDGSGYNIKNYVTYYEILPDGEEKELEGKDGTETTKKIVDIIGTEKDFMTTILATSKNLEDLIETQATARGKLLTRFIGLEIIEQKERAARDMYNEFKKKMKSNVYNLIDLSNEVEEHKERIESVTNIKEQNSQKLEKIKKELVEYNNERDRLLEQKQTIDENIIQLDPVKIKKEIDEITEKGKTEKVNHDTYEKRLKEIGEISFDESLYRDKVKDKLETESKIKENGNEAKRLSQLISDLQEGEICPTCNRPLEGVDNSGEIEKNRKKIDDLEVKTNKLKKTLGDLNIELVNLTNDRDLANEKDKLDLKKDRSEVELGSLRNDLKSKKNDLEKYKLNNSVIELNKKIDIEIMGVKGKIQRHEGDRDMIISKIQKCEDDIEQNKKDIITKENLITTIKKEDQVEKIYNIYIDMVGRKGISKLVLRSVLPIINFELHRLLDEVVDFDVELEINSKNEVDFILVKDEVRKYLKSGSGLETTTASLALRCVLGRVSNLPKPNFIGFDEILGKVASENLPYIKDLFDKIRDMYDIVFLITHNTLVKDWADNIITIKKENNISTITGL
jgi:DNA repair exonuclease SbcCD ATPase subunit